MAKTVVLIDDDQDDLEVVKETLKTIDKSLLCISFNYPKEAVRVVTKELVLVPDYIFIDINMPGMTGDVVLKELRKVSELDHTVITMLSTSMPYTISEALKNDGANFVFQKPNRMEDYRKVISGILNGPA